MVLKPNAGDRLAKHVAVCASKEMKKCGFWETKKRAMRRCRQKSEPQKISKIPGMKDEEIAMDVAVMFQDVSRCFKHTPHLRLNSKGQVEHSFTNLFFPVSSNASEKMSWAM